MCPTDALPLAIVASRGTASRPESHYSRDHRLLDAFPRLEWCCRSVSIWSAPFCVSEQQEAPTTCRIYLTFYHYRIGNDMHGNSLIGRFGPAHVPLQLLLPLPAHFRAPLPGILRPSVLRRLRRWCSSSKVGYGAAHLSIRAANREERGSSYVLCGYVRMVN